MRLLKLFVISLVLCLNTRSVEAHYDSIVTTKDWVMINDDELAGDNNFVVYRRYAPVLNRDASGNLTMDDIRNVMNYACAIDDQSLSYIIYFVPREISVKEILGSNYFSNKSFVYEFRDGKKLAGSFEVKNNQLFIDQNASSREVFERIRNGAEYILWLTDNYGVKFSEFTKKKLSWGDGKMQTIDEISFGQVKMKFKGKELQTTTTDKLFELCQNEASPKSVDDWDSCGSTDFELSIRVCTAIINSGNGSKENQAVAFTNRGIAYDTMGEYDLALADYDRAIALDPASGNAFSNRGMLYGHEGNYDKAIADFDKAIALNPKDVDAYSNRGITYSFKGEHDRAIADYNMAISINPKFVNAYSNRGNSFARKKEYARAIADYDMAITLNPKYAYAYNNRGDVYAETGKLNLALADFKLALTNMPSSDPQYSTVQKNIADTEQKLAAATTTLENDDAEPTPDLPDELKEVGCGTGCYFSQKLLSPVEVVENVYRRMHVQRVEYLLRGDGIVDNKRDYDSWVVVNCKKGVVDVWATSPEPSKANWSSCEGDSTAEGRAKTHCEFICKASTH